MCWNYDRDDFSLAAALTPMLTRIQIGWTKHTDFELKCGTKSSYIAASNAQNFSSVKRTELVKSTRCA